MAPARLVEDISWSSPAFVPEPYEGPPRNVKAIDEIKFHEAVKYPKYEILGTDPNSKILFVDVSILDCTGREPYRGDVYIEGQVAPQQTPCFKSAIAAADISQANESRQSVMFPTRLNWSKT